MQSSIAVCKQWPALAMIDDLIAPNILKLLTIKGICPNSDTSSPSAPSVGADADVTRPEGLIA